MIDLNRMGRKEINDYVIYKLVCLSNPDLVYVGSTANFYARRICHKCRANTPNNKEYNNKKYVAIRENGGWDNWNMVIVDELKQITLIKSTQVEEEWRVKLNANLNSLKCFVTETKEDRIEYIAQYRVKNKDIRLEWQKEYYEKNKELVLEKAKEKVTCVCGCVTRKHDLLKHMRTQKHLKLLAQQTTEVN